MRRSGRGAAGGGAREGGAAGETGKGLGVGEGARGQTRRGVGGPGGGVVEGVGGGAGGEMGRGLMNARRAEEGEEIYVKEEKREEHEDEREKESEEERGKSRESTGRRKSSTRSVGIARVGEEGEAGLRKKERVGAGGRSRSRDWGRRGRGGGIGSEDSERRVTDRPTVLVKNTAVKAWHATLGCFMTCNGFHVRVPVVDVAQEVNGASGFHL
ncbi:hypothetical protein CBR_g40429 [Chara braunii]|uniref:Uncharacterized protein n=1 Tax=Chara braunii TaxID=69332 RepID=A0A388LTW5_CHABU|nr:hypothetical protein CBR_g40429 [Chara braunii]|eukprot:GBG85699.1 hypothetical protein CBR_g40429 [Chara braunii]